MLGICAVSYTHLGLPAASGNCSRPVLGFHIHAGEACSGTPEEPFKDADGHFNQGGCDHPYHAGDMPPLFANDGYAFSAFLTDRFTIDEVIGRTVIIHADPDDFTNQPSGLSLIHIFGKGAVRPAAIRPVKTGENGVFEQTIALSETLDGGYYVVYATSGAGEAQARFLFVNRQQSAPALALLNGARTAGETEQVLRQNAEKFGVTAQQMEGKAAFAAAVAFGRKPASGYPEIYQAVTVIKSALVIKDVIDAPDSPAGVLEKNEELLGISYAQYAALGERTRNKLDALLKKADYTNTDFAQIYQDQLLLARITAAENWSQLQKVALDVYKRQLLFR